MSNVCNPELLQSACVSEVPVSHLHNQGLLHVLKTANLHVHDNTHGQH